MIQYLPQSEYPGVRKASAFVRALGILALTLGAQMFPAPLQAVEATRLLSESGDPYLQSHLEWLVYEQGLWDAVSSGRLAVALVIVTDPENPRLAEINGHQMVYAASLPKIAILLAAAAAVHERRLIMDSSLERDLNDMIRYSCNDCATRALDRVGRQYLIDTLQSPEYQFYDQAKAGGLWVGKDYGPRKAYKRDPLAGLSHGATAFQAARFYYKLYTRTLVSPEASEMMLGMLVNPGISHKFVKGLEGYEDLTIYRKSGTWKIWHADSALVTVDDAAYIMVALANDPGAAEWLVRLAGPMHELAVSLPGQTGVSSE